MYGIGGEHDLSERELAAPARLARLGPRAGRQRRLGPDPARRLRRAAQLAPPLPRAARRRCTPRSRRSSPTSPTPPRGAGARPTRACGRCAASRATTSPPRSSAGPRSTAPCASRRSSASTPRPSEWSAARDEIRAADPRSRLDAKRARPTPSPSTPTSSTPRAADADLRLPAGRPTRACARRSRRSPRDLTEDGLVLRYRNERGPERRRPHRRGGHVRDLLVLARHLPRPGRRGRPRAGAVRPARRATPTTSG